MYREISLVALYNYAPSLFMTPASSEGAGEPPSRPVMTQMSTRYATWWIDTILNIFFLLFAVMALYNTILYVHLLCRLFITL